MTELKESKEKLPISFLTDFISKGWEEVGYLKADIEAIKEAYKGTDKIEELIQGLIDAYLVCIGQLEAHISDGKYIEFPEESKLGEPKKESLSEAIDIHVDENEVIIADASGEDVAIIPIEPDTATATEEPICVGPECEVPPAKVEINPIVADDGEFNTPFAFDVPEADGVRKFEKPEVADFFVDFDDPVGEPVTEKELYGEGEDEIENEKIDDEIKEEE